MAAVHRARLGRHLDARDRRAARLLITAIQAATLLTGDLFPAPQLPAPE
jgi:hypothetical protein